MQTTKILTVLFVLLIAGPAYAEYGVVDIAATMSLDFPVNPTIFSKTTIVPAVVNVGTSTALIKEYLLTVEYLDANCDVMCVSEQVLIHCFDSCGQLAPGEKMNVNSHEFVPYYSTFTGGPVGTYRFEFSVKSDEKDTNSTNNTSSSVITYSFDQKSDVIVKLISTDYSLESINDTAYLTFIVSNKGNASATLSEIEAQILDQECTEMCIDISIAQCYERCPILPPGGNIEYNFPLTPSELYGESASGIYKVVGHAFSSDGDADSTNNSQSIDLFFGSISAEICDDQIDNDNNGKIDCEDLPVCLDYCFAKLNNAVSEQQSKVSYLEDQYKNLIQQIAAVEEHINVLAERIGNILCTIDRSC